MSAIITYQRNYYSATSNQTNLNDFIAGLEAQLITSLGINSGNLSNAFLGNRAYATVAVSDQLDQEPRLEPLINIGGSVFPPGNEIDVDIDQVNLIISESVLLIHEYESRLLANDFDSDGLINETDPDPGNAAPVVAPIPTDIEVDAWVKFNSSGPTEYEQRLYKVVSIDGLNIEIEDTFGFDFFGIESQNTSDVITVESANYTVATIEEIIVWAEYCARAFFPKNKIVRQTISDEYVYLTDGFKPNISKLMYETSLGGEVEIWDYTTGWNTGDFNIVNKIDNTSITCVLVTDRITGIEYISYNGEAWFQR